MLRPIEIIDKNNRLTGEISDPNDANVRGLWCRGAHIILYTSSGHVLLQKRSSNAMQHPNMLDIGAGGFVDKDETPQDAAIRETFEETGLRIKAEDLIFLGTSKHNYRWRYKKEMRTCRTILYTFAGKLDGEEYIPHPQSDEVSWIGFVPLKSAWWLIRRGVLKRIGHLAPTYAYYRKALKQTAKFIRD
jgi:isopentenyl-diphosphate Delta-isomerase